MRAGVPGSTVTVSADSRVRPLKYAGFNGGRVTEERAAVRPPGAADAAAGSTAEAAVDVARAGEAAAAPPNGTVAAEAAKAASTPRREVWVMPS
ncbi:hypothetical protein GCM10010391_49050 [Streptomyces anthocyanicus]|nr:hypothetical protein GCM10010391_49050 [Streptomyces anthocyanicus]